MTITDKEYGKLGQGYQPKTGERCHCKRGVMRDNCPDCEGTGWRIDFKAIRARATDSISQSEGV